MPRPTNLMLTLAVLLGAAGIPFAAAPSAALEGAWTIRSGAPENRVRFESHAPMESFEGSTGKVEGKILFDPAAIGDSITVEVEVDLASLDTGISLRNRHMRENHLETDTYPTAVFRGGRVSDRSADALEIEKAVSFQLAGTFTLHGVTREITVPVTVTRRETLIAIDTHFDIHLADYDISRPKFLMLKLDQVQNVTVHLIADPTE